MAGRAVSFEAYQLKHFTYLLGGRCYGLEPVVARIGSDEPIDKTLHVPRVRTRNIVVARRIKSDGLAIRRNRSHHAQLASIRAILTEQQAVTIEVDHHDPAFVTAPDCS